MSNALFRGVPYPVRHDGRLCLVTTFTRANHDHVGTNILASHNKFLNNSMGLTCLAPLNRPQL